MGTDSKTTNRKKVNLGAAIKITYSILVHRTLILTALFRSFFRLGMFTF